VFYFQKGDTHSGKGQEFPIN